VAAMLSLLIAEGGKFDRAMQRELVNGNVGSGVWKLFSASARSFAFTWPAAYSIAAPASPELIVPLSTRDSVAMCARAHCHRGSRS
jgi:hypothetical protein